MGIFSPNIDRLVEKNDTGALIRLLRHRKPEIRLQAFLALARARDEAVLGEIRKMLDDPDPRVRAVATLKFGELGQPGITENLRAIIISGSQRDKIEALRLLADRGATTDL